MDCLRMVFEMRHAGRDEIDIPYAKYPHNGDCQCQTPQVPAGECSQRDLIAYWSCSSALPGQVEVDVYLRGKTDIAKAHISRG